MASALPSSPRKETSSGGSSTPYYPKSGDAVSAASIGAAAASHWYVISELDALAKRLQANDATKKVGALNQGAGGNQVLTGGGLGTPAQTRFDHDVVEPARSLSLTAIGQLGSGFSRLGANHQLGAGSLGDFR